MIDYQKFCEVCMWEQYQDETYEDTFLRQEIKAQELPPLILIDVVHADGVEGWAKKTKLNSLSKLYREIMRIFKLASVDKINNNKKIQEMFPPIYNFCVYATRLDRNGRTSAEAFKIAESAWWGDIALKMLKEKTTKIFDVEPSNEKYKAAAEKIQKIWGFNNIEIEAFRYFVCQSRHENHNPSMNKSLYLWSGSKQTGKTTVARAIASILNGELNLDNAGNFESTFNKELQINDHDLPLAAQYNCVILDEAMPKDSRKSYGRVKAMLTSNSCSFNQKYGQIRSIKVRRNYIYTSNDDIVELIQDMSERRFIQVRMDKKPRQISFDEIYTIWKEFAQNCEPETDWQEWYNTFEDVEGLQRKDMSEYKAEILNNYSILQSLRNRQDYSITAKFFEDILIRGKSTSGERETLKKALIELFGEPKYYKWSKKEMLSELEMLISRQDIEDKISDVDDAGMPF